MKPTIREDKFKELGLQSVNVENNFDTFNSTKTFSNHHIYRGTTITLGLRCGGELKITWPFGCEESAYRIAQFINDEERETMEKYQKEIELENLRERCKKQEEELLKLRPPHDEDEHDYE